MPDSTAKLREVALATRQNAYVPYSNFRVGAAVEMEDGSIFGGANIENAAHPQALCAERSAIVSAVSAGHRQIRRVYVVAEPLAAPCGGCRSVIAEFSTPDTEIIMADPQGQERRFLISDLLPHAFELQHDIQLRKE